MTLLVDPPKRTLHVHRLIAKTAEELCQASYEILMAQNDIRAEWRRTHPGFSEKHLRRAYVKKYLRSHIGPARTTLTLMLNSDLPDAQKAEIHEALCLDNTLVRGRNAALEPKGSLDGGSHDNGPNAGHDDDQKRRGRPVVIAGDDNPG